MNELNAPLTLISNYSFTEMLVNSLLGLVVGYCLSLIYQRTHKGLSYSQGFVHTIIFVTFLITIVMMVVGGNLARAFTLVGAMSIIRFRTVLKDTKDLVYIFGGLALGMAAGVSNYELTFIGLLVFTLSATIIHLTNFGSMFKSEFILRFRFSQKANSSEYLQIIKDHCKRANLLHIEPSGDSKTLMHTYDILLMDGIIQSQLITKLNSISGISEIVLIASKNDIDY